MARAGRKASGAAKRRQTTRAGQGRGLNDGGTPELAALKRAVTRRADLPLEPLAVLYGHGRIDEEAYRAGLRLEQARRAQFGADTAAQRGFYEGGPAQAADQWAARQAAGGFGNIKQEARAEAEYGRLLKVLQDCGREVAAATLGIATRPYAGAWVATALVEKQRWSARHDRRLELIRLGLAAIARLGSRPL